LRIVTLVLVAGTAVVVALNYFNVTVTARLFWVNLFPNALVLGLGCVLAALVWARRGWSLRQLRWVEFAVFAEAALACAWWEFRRLHLEGFLDRYAQRDPMETTFLARYHGALWFVLIVNYGLLIPNTAWRCAVATGLIALVAGATGALSLLLNESVGAVRAIKYLGDVGIFLLMGLCLAVYGAHRINVLQERMAAARQLGPYRLRERLGAGGMGEVYLAEHRLLKRPCAVKLIRPERAGDPALLRRFEREVQAMTRLSHPNAAQVYDYGHTEDGTFYYAMEYLPGLSLDEVVRRHGPLPPARVVHLLRQVCGALAEAHGLGLVHRDLKPSNIMVCRFGERADVAKLLDFGLVQGIDLDDPATRLTRAGTVLGTPEYMSPEQARGETALDPRSDLYNLGATAYYLLTARPPFVCPTVLQTLFAHASTPVRPLTDVRPDVPADLQAVILRSMAKEPSQRYPDAGSLATALARCNCAADWTEEQAASWWRTNAAPPGTTVVPLATTEPHAWEAPDRSLGLRTANEELRTPPPPP
jgi:serine/threonine-protein kinase